MANVNQGDILQILLSAEKPKKQITMKRFNTDFTIQAIDNASLSKIREQASFGGKLDNETFNFLIIKEGCVVPNWGDKSLIEKYKTAQEAISAILMSGECAKLVSEILSLSGFIDDGIEGL